MRTLPPPVRSVRPPQGLDPLASPTSARTLRPPRLPDLEAPGPVCVAGARGTSIEQRFANGGLELGAPATDVLVMRLWGHLDLDLVERVIAIVETRLAITGRRFETFNDWSELTSHDTQARVRFTSWVQEVRDRFEAVHILTRSRLVSMAVAVANLALDGFLITYGPDQSARYAEALQSALRRRAPRG